MQKNQRKQRVNNMKKYILTSQSFKGNIFFGYEEGFLVHYDNQSQMEPVQLRWLLTNFPLTFKNLEAIKPKIKGRIEEVPVDVSFDGFWEAYGKKLNRKRCEPLWRKLTESDQITCIKSIPAYNSYLKRMNGRAKLDPENYLRTEAFQNPWNSLTS